MEKIFNKTEEKCKRKSLRRNMTSAERRLYLALKNGETYGFRFVRQSSIEGFVVDFYCRRLRLAIEVDGGIHNIDGSKEYDRQRQDILENKYKVQFIRFSNDEVLNDIPYCMNRIRKQIKNRKQTLRLCEGELSRSD